MDKYRKMTEEEIARQDPLKQHTHPSKVLKNLINLIKEVGAKRFLEGAGYNKERDAFFGCMFALAMRAYQGREFYIQQMSDPPDFELIAPTDRPKNEKPFDHANVEVVSIPIKVDQVDDKVKFATNVLERTKLIKKYEQGTILLIFVSGSCGPDLVRPLREWVKSNHSKLMNLGEIMMMYLVSVSEIQSFIYEVVSLSKTWIGKFSLSEEFKKPFIEHPMIRKYGVYVEK